MLLRYTGSTPVTFTRPGVEAEPGGTFEVPDDEAAGFLARADIEAAPDENLPTDKAPRGKRAAKTTDPETPSAGDGATPAGQVPDPTDTP
ncbi:MAG: hypothetical protein HOW97_09615 [Catenulispora sp.]|nr:hypothetical protein [Catenulispora sp.]